MFSLFFIWMFLFVLLLTIAIKKSEKMPKVYSDTVNQSTNDDSENIRHKPKR